MWSTGPAHRQARRTTVWNDRHSHESAGADEDTSGKLSIHCVPLMNSPILSPCCGIQALVCQISHQQAHLSLLRSMSAASRFCIPGTETPLPPKTRPVIVVHRWRCGSSRSAPGAPRRRTGSGRSRTRPSLPRSPRARRRSGRACRRTARSGERRRGVTRAVRARSPGTPSPGRARRGRSRRTAPHRRRCRRA